MNKIEEVKKEFRKYINKGKAEFLPKFFKAVPGGYGEGDKFIGVIVPEQKKVAKKFKNLSLDYIHKLLNENIHEYRLTALFILIAKFAKGNDKEKEQIVKLYLENYDRINNWDLVDSSAAKILGPFLIDKNKSILYNFAKSNHLWKQRIAIITTQYFIKNNLFEDTFKISEILLNHKHDLIHKAVGWMLREVGNKNPKAEKDFLKKHYKNMPRTMLRYAIEKFTRAERTKYLKGRI